VFWLVLAAYVLFPAAPGGRTRRCGASSVAAGGLLYRFVEAPFLALRDRRVPSNFVDAPPAPGGEPAGAVSAAGAGSP
jgi:peptidoglycan/LPS O-acetylase OafA/YrhL